MSDTIQMKELVIKGLRDILNTCDLSELNLTNNVTCQHASGVTDWTLQNCSKSIKSFVELSLTNDLENLIDKISHVKNETWKIDAHNLAKIILEESKLTHVQDNLKNIIDSCIHKAQETNRKQLNDSEIDISPLLQPEHVSEITDCMSLENPTDIRLNALRVLLKSHVSEIVNEETWKVLQKKLVENLCDSNVDIFDVCLKVHAKLGSCSSSLAMKECSLNILDSLGRHYLLHHNESKVISLQSMFFYRIVYLTRLLLDTFREATLSVARFGESRLDEMIEHFINLMTIHIPSKSKRNKIYLSPLEVVSYLDPKANWLKNFVHNALTRKLLLSSISKNMTFMQISMEEIIHWVNEPVIPSREVSNVSHGEINFVVQKFSMFCHSLSVVSTICVLSSSCSLFPMKISKQEQIIRLESLLELLISLLNNPRFSDMMKNKASVFVDLFTSSFAKLLSTSYVDSKYVLSLLMSTSNGKCPLENPLQLNIFNTLFKNVSWSNEIIGSGLVRRKHSLLSSFSKFKLNNELLGNIQIKLDFESQSSLRVSEESGAKDLIPLEVLLKHVTDKLNFLEINEVPQLLTFVNQILRRFEKTINCPYIMQIVHLVCKMYLKLIDSLKNLGLKHKTDDILLIECCEEFLLQTASTPLGFHHLQQKGVIASLFLSKLHHPLTNSSDNVYLIFVSKAASSDEGACFLQKESNGVLRNYFDSLWNSLEDYCSGSEMSVNDKAKSLYKIVAFLCIGLKGLKALSRDLNEGSEITLTADDHDLKPTNLCLLIQHLALNDANCLDFMYHEIALNILEILVSNIDSRLYLQKQFKFQDILLQLQSDNRIEENSGVIVDECSILRQRIIDRSVLPNRFKLQTVPSHIVPRPESTLAHTRTRSRGNGDLARWLSETRLGLHDNNWLKHVRKLYKNTCPDEIKGATIMDLLEQVVKVVPGNNLPMKWRSRVFADFELEQEEKLGIQLVVRYGIHLRLIQSSQQNSENLDHLLQLVKASFDDKSNEFERFDWFLATVYIVCSGNIEKTQSFLSLVTALPNGPLIWYRIRDEYVYAQLGNALEMIISEEMPSLFQILFREGLSWWNLCSVWIDQCWWHVLEWPHICHWLVISILYPLDHIIYFCAAILYANHDRLLQLAPLGTIYEIIINPVEKFNFSEAKHFIEKLHKKYHISMQHYFA